MEEGSIIDAFLAMKQAYEQFLRDAEVFRQQLKQHQMNLPPTLGSTINK